MWLKLCTVKCFLTPTLIKFLVLTKQQQQQQHCPIRRFRLSAQLLSTAPASRWGHPAWHWAAALWTHGAAECSQRLESWVGWRANPTPSSQSTGQRGNYNHITQHCSLTAIWLLADYQRLTHCKLGLLHLVEMQFVRLALLVHVVSFAITCPDKSPGIKDHNVKLNHMKH